jgi:putative phosphoesterase
VAVLSDVHANVHALWAVLAELERAPVELLVFSGDITWGSFPRETVDIIQALTVPVVLVRGNTDRAVLELADGTREPASARDEWMVANHRPSDLEWLRGTMFAVDLEVGGVGVVRVCHGSPRDDTEALTQETPPARLSAACAGVTADVLLTGHTHLQFDRALPGRPARLVNPGSVGLPYHDGRPGAHWLRIDGGFDFAVTAYDLDTHLLALAGTDDPKRDVVAAMLRTPPTPREIIEHAERVEFVD